MSSHPSIPQPLSYDRTISAYFFWLIVVMCLTLATAVILYGEPFTWDYAFSDLGSTATWEGKVNAASGLVFTIGGLTCGWIMLHIWAAYTGDIRFSRQKTKRNLGTLGTAGYLLSSVPNSQHHIVHTIGAVCTFASLVLFSVIFYIELRQTMPPWRFVLEMAGLWAVVLTYAVAFFADWPSKQLFQKLCLIGVYYTVLRAVNLGEERFRLRDALRVVRSF